MRAVHGHQFLGRAAAVIAAILRRHGPFLGGPWEKPWIMRFVRGSVANFS